MHRNSAQKILRVCHYCGQEFKAVSDNFCSRKCHNLDEIADAVQKINYGVELLKEKPTINSDQIISDIIKTIETSSTEIAKNISSVQYEISK
jgi:hypothetical protein